MGVPLTVDTLGARSGFRIGVNITTGRHSPVLQDLGGLTENDISGSFGICGELGSGKSALGKTIGSHSIDRGALLVAVDHSDNQEWAALARSLTTANVIDFMNPDQSLDPLRLWTSAQQKQRHTLTLLSMMLGVSATDQRYGLINAELKRLVQDKAVEPSMTAFKEHLASGAIAPDDQQLAREIARQLDIYADLDFARAFFDPTLPTMNFEAQATVFCTHGMALPTKEELFTESSRREMSLAKMMGRAAYAYLAEVGTSIMYADDSQEVLFLVDEAHHMTGSPEGEAAIMTAVKTSRKHLSAVGLISHTADELGSEQLRGLIPQRFVFRTRDRNLARKNLIWLDETYARDEYVDLITRDTSPMGTDGRVAEERRGEALYRDHLNRVGKIKVMLPLTPSRRKTVLTTPPKRSERKEAVLA
jgi:ABC-type dipeptide/oligopeptide/nickel transport system ATPase subunit